MLERKLFFGIDDLQGICLECLSCAGRLHVPLVKITKIPERCPVCGADWDTPGTSRNVSDSPYASFAFALRRLRETVAQGSNAAFKVLFEFDEPDR
jgi:hypothetical protein